MHNLCTNQIKGKLQKENSKNLLTLEEPNLTISELILQSSKVSTTIRKINNLQIFVTQANLIISHRFCCLPKEISWHIDLLSTPILIARFGEQFGTWLQFDWLSETTEGPCPPENTLFLKFVGFALFTTCFFFRIRFFPVFKTSFYLHLVISDLRFPLRRKKGQTVCFYLSGMIQKVFHLIALGNQWILILHTNKQFAILKTVSFISERLFHL